MKFKNIKKENLIKLIKALGDYPHCFRRHIFSGRSRKIWICLGATAEQVDSWNFEGAAPVRFFQLSDNGVKAALRWLHVE